LALFSVLKRNGSIAWREGSASFLFISIGAAISLIGQTYNISGDTSSFLLSWMLLGVPLVYLMDVTLPGIFYLAGITVWSAVARFDSGDYPFLYWLLLAVLLPHFIRKFKINPYSNQSVFLGLGSIVSACFALGFTHEGVLPAFWMILYSAFFPCIYLAGKYWFNDADMPFWQRPLETFGRLGVLVITFVLTFRGNWDSISNHYAWRKADLIGWTKYLDFVMAGAFILGALWLAYLLIRKKKHYDVMFSILPVITIAGYTSAYLLDNAVIPMIIFNLFLLSMGLVTVAKGFRSDHMGIINGGMLIVAALAVARFFDSDIQFIIKGIAFIIVGASFLVSNILIMSFMKKRRGELK
jgi:hypothetical protein